MFLIKGRCECRLTTLLTPPPWRKAALLMRRTIVLLVTMTLTVLVASGVVLGAGIGSAGAQSSVVGPGESIQKAVNAAHPGDTIVVRGVHREDVIIRKNGIKLRGDDAVIEAPTRAKADSPCSKAAGRPEAICVWGDFNINTGKLTGQRVSDVSVSGFTIRGFKIKGKEDNSAFVIDVVAARNATVVGNHTTGNVAGGISAFRSVNTTVAKNHVIGSPETDSVGINVEGDSRNTKVVNNVVRGISGSRNARNAIEVEESIDTTVAGNDLIDDWLGVFLENSTGTKVLSNDMSRSGYAGIFMVGPKPANAKVVGNNISGGAWGIYVDDTKRGSFAGNTVHDNCFGMYFEGFESQPVGEFEVKGNTVENNTHSCRAAQFGINFSGIGIALIGASGMELTGNHLSGNVPSGPTAVSGGVVVATDPFGLGTTKPRNNSVTGNHFGHNKPDIFWDESGSGNRFVGNLCNSSVPGRLCN
jgi:parallel beta-helix repeat protein